jgi:hypothetical protein
MFHILGVIYVTNPIPLIITGALFYKMYQSVPKWISKVIKNRTKKYT